MNSCYVGKGPRGFDKLFGVNFADGRIKGYDLLMPGGGMKKTFFVQCVRGNPSYGKNDFHDNGDGTITDRATGLMWSKADSGTGMNWQNAQRSDPKTGDPAQFPHGRGPQGDVIRIFNHVRLVRATKP